MIYLQHKVKSLFSENKQHSGLRLVANVLQYIFSKKGRMATSSHEVCASAKTRPELDRPDAQIVSAPFSLELGPPAQFKFEPWHGIQVFGYQMRPESQGSIMIRSADPAEQPVIRPSFLSAEVDRQSAIAIMHYLRRLVKQPALQEHVAEETFLGPGVRTDDEILDVIKRAGSSGFHAAGTCKMGQDSLAVVDNRLRVRGVTGLRVVDASVMPTLVSGNTNGPVMAIGWRASDLILEDA